MLQHRGQDAAGILTSDGNRVYLRKDNGLVRDVFQQHHMLGLRGNMGIGHVRYPTAGCDSPAEAQPFYVNSPFGLALAHNGNLTNAAALKDELFREDLRHINTESDSEILLNVFAHELQAVAKLRLTPDQVFRAVAAVHRRARGAYAVTMLIAGVGIVAFRDPYGIRPLVYGRRDTDNGPEVVFASESVALDVLGFDLVRDVAPGEAIFVGLDGQVHAQQCADKPVLSPCIFEFVYFARPDSMMDNVYVHKTRLRMGERLAAKIERVWPDVDIDVVIPIPDTSRTSALQMAYASRHPVPRGLHQEPLHRSHLHHARPGRAQEVGAPEAQRHRCRVPRQERAAGRRLDRARHHQQADHPDGARGRCAGRCTSPRRRRRCAFPNVYGIDMPTVTELVAQGRTKRDRAAIGADR